MKGKEESKMHRHKNNLHEDDDLTGYPSYPATEDDPAAELDDDMEMIGDEDEENNHYSLGRDNHNDPEEDYN